MENYTIVGDYKQPDIILDADSGLIKVSGRSIPEYPSEFYKPIIEWLANYVKNPAEETTIHYQLEYYNSASNRYLLDILEMFTPLHKSGKKITFKWYYEEDDDEAKDSGVVYGDLVEYQVNLIPVPVED